MVNYTREQPQVLARLNAEDLEEADQRMRTHSRLGFTYRFDDALKRLTGKDHFHRISMDKAAWHFKSDKSHRTGTASVQQCGIECTKHTGARPGRYLLSTAQQ